MIIIFFLILIILIIVLIYFCSQPNDKIIVAGCAWNCGKYADAVFDNIKKITQLYNDYLIIIAYDKSDDDTLEKLKNHQMIHGNKMILILGEKKSKIRTENLCVARTKILLEIKRQYMIQKFQHFIIMDLDDVSIGPLKINVLRHFLKKNNEHWDALSFNRKKYYDIWALSYDPFIISLFHWKKVERLFIQHDIENRLKKTPLLRCYSAFNGFCIYRAGVFIHSFYDWRVGNNLKFLSDQMIVNNKKAFPTENELVLKDEMDCEHRHYHFYAHFHLGARIMISSQSIFDG